MHALYQACSGWTDRGILFDLDRLHGIADPDLDLLVCIAQALVGLDRRIHQRIPTWSKELTIGWLNYHYNILQPHIQNLVIRTGDGEALGPRADEFEKWAAANPDSEVMKYLND
jgi:hypothetical protein